MAARLARRIGEKPERFDREADKILAAMNRVLWMADRGWYAEYRDLLGLQRLHPSAELPSIYHPIDSSVPDPFQAWQMLRYVDTDIEHIPIEGNAAMLWSSNWVPFIWSVRDVCGVEVAHTALANWQAGRPKEAYDLWRGAILDSMFCCRAPGACIGTSELDSHMTGLCTDFADTVGMYARTRRRGASLASCPTPWKANSCSVPACRRIGLRPRSIRPTSVTRTLAPVQRNRSRSARSSADRCVCGSN